jgi:hypothetical protein
MQTFDPNQVSFDECLERIRPAAEKADLDTRRVITSRDADRGGPVEALGA